MGRKMPEAGGIRDLECVCEQWWFLTSGVAYVAAVMGSETLFPPGIWSPGARATKGMGGGSHFLGIPGYSFICVYIYVCDGKRMEWETV